jgi:hypothetical protein
MNIQKIFEAVAGEPDQATIIVVALELERQGYNVIINKKYKGSKGLFELDEQGDLTTALGKNGVHLSINKGKDKQEFRMHFLDLDAVCFTKLDSHPVIYDQEYTTGFYKSGKNN